MIIKRCIICIAGTDFLDGKLELTKDRNKALVFTGKKNAKKMVDWLKKRGVFSISLIEVDSKGA